MILDYQKVAHIFIVCRKTDLRKGINVLAASSSMSIIWMCTQCSFLILWRQTRSFQNVVLRKRWFPTFIQALGLRTASLAEIKKRNSVSHASADSLVIGRLGH